MKKIDKRELLKHFRWLVAITYENACGFTQEEQNKNEQIAEILRNLED